MGLVAMFAGSPGSILILLISLANIGVMMYSAIHNTHVVLSRYDLYILAIAFGGLVLFETILIISQVVGIPIGDLVLVSRATRLIVAASSFFVMHRAMARQFRLISACPPSESGERADVS